MSLSRQESSRTTGGPSNQKARTRAALLRAATELGEEGDRRRCQKQPIGHWCRSPPPTATSPRPRTCGSRQPEAIEFEPRLAEAEAASEASGEDPVVRLEVLTRTVGFHMLDEQAAFRRLARAALDQWFNQVGSSESEAAPVREGRRNRHIALVLEPLRGTVSDGDLERLAHALGLVVGTTYFHLW